MRTLNNGCFIELPSGESIRTSAVMAIRLGDPRSKGKEVYETEAKPRVIVDYVIGGVAGCMIQNCETILERDELAKELNLKLFATHE